MRSPTGRGRRSSRTCFPSMAGWVLSRMAPAIIPGMALFGAILLGLYERQKSGRGCKVSTSLLANGAWANATMLQAQLAGAALSEKRPRARAYNFASLHYKTADDRLLRMSILNVERDWPRLCTAIDQPELTSDPRLAELASRAQ